MANNNTLNYHYTTWFVDNDGNKISIQQPNEQHIIANGRVTLKCIPDRFYKLTITGMNEIPYNKTITDVSQFKTNYNDQSCLVFFHSSKEGQTVNITYYGIGQIFIDASRIVTESQNGNQVLQTLKELTDQTNTAKDETIQATTNAITSTNTVNQTNTDFKVFEPFDPLKTYKPLNKVTFFDSSYLCIQQCTGKYPYDTQYWIKISSRGSDGFASLVENIVSTVADNTTHIVTGFTDFEPATDKLEVYFDKYKTLLENGVHYSINSDKLSIDLIGWSVEKDKNFYLKMYKNLNQDNVVLVNDARDIVQGFEDKGDYNSATNYVKNNLVYYNGETYICKTPCVNIIPTNNTYWYKVVRRGKDGFASILENTVTIPTAGLTNVVHGFDSFDPLVDKLEAYYGDYKVLLDKGTEYSENANNLSIDLIGWTTSSDDKFYFKLYKNLNQDNINLVNNADQVVKEFKFLLEYNPATTYKPMNMVYYNGELYGNILTCINIYPTNTTYWMKLNRHGNDGWYSFEKTTVTVASDNTSHIVHNLSYDPTHDMLEVIDVTFGSELILGSQYTENANNISIDLVGWTVNTGYKFTIKIYKGVNDATLEQTIQNAIAERTSLNNKILESQQAKVDLQTVIENADTVTYTTKGETGLLTNLSTTDKTSIVNAINEHKDRLDNVDASLNDIVTVNIKQFPRTLSEPTDMPRIQRAINYLNSIGGGSLFFPIGTYTVNPTSTSSIILKSNIKLYGIKGKSIIKIVDNNGNYNQILWQVYHEELKNITIEGLVFDHNVENNMVSAIANISNRDTMYLETIDGLTIKDCTFYTDGTNPIRTRSGSLTDYRAKNIKIIDNYFEYIETAGLVRWDNTTLTIMGLNVEIRGNKFYTNTNKTDTTDRSYTGAAIEVSGYDIEVYNNHVENYLNGLDVLCCDTSPIEHNIQIHNNTFKDVTKGVQLWSRTVETVGTILSGVKIYDNTVILNFTKHQYKLYSDIRGVGLSANSSFQGECRNINIDNNKISVPTDQIALISTNAGTTEKHFGIYITGYVVVNNIKIRKNEITNFPTSVIYAVHQNTNYKITNLEVVENTFIDCGTAQQSFAVFRFAKQYKNVLIKNNKLIDTGSTMKGKYSFVFDPSANGASYENFTLENNTEITTSGTAYQMIKNDLFKTLILDNKTKKVSDNTVSISAGSSTVNFTFKLNKTMKEIKSNTYLVKINGNYNPTGSGNYNGVYVGLLNFIGLYVAPNVTLRAVLTPLVNVSGVNGNETVTVNCNFESSGTADLAITSSTASIDENFVVTASGFVNTRLDLCDVNVVNINNVFTLGF